MNKLIGCGLVLLLAACAVPEQPGIHFQTDFSKGDLDAWSFENPQNWQLVEIDGEPALELSSPGEMGDIRKPASMAILNEPVVGDFELTVRARCYTEPENTYRDICLFFGYQDSVHFYYTHFSARSDKVHNIIGIVNNADRKKINLEPPGESEPRLTSDGWYTLKITRDAETGKIAAYVDDLETPILTAVDTTFRTGKIGIGSFDDTGAFASLILISKDEHNIENHK